MDEIVEEAGKQSVILVFTVLSVVATLIVVDLMSGPDQMRTLKMKSYLWAKRYADKRVNWWQDLATKAATRYQREKY